MIGTSARRVSKLAACASLIFCVSGCYVAPVPAPVAYAPANAYYAPGYYAAPAYPAYGYYGGPSLNLDIGGRGGYGYRGRRW